MINVRYNYSLLHHNSFHLDVYASEFAEYDTESDLQAYLQICDRDKKILHIGGGNNLLFTQDFKGIILHSAIKGVEIVEDNANYALLRVGAAEIWDEIVEKTLRQNLYGLENLSLIPSEMGAAAVQNIGAYGAEAKDFIHSVEVIDLESGEKRVLSADDCGFGYRYSHFKGTWKGRYAITYVNLRLSKSFVPNINYKALSEATTSDMSALQVRETVIKIRNAKLPDPQNVGNAGSFFINPVVSEQYFQTLRDKWEEIPHYNVENGVKVPAAWLIEQCGWKGRALGAAAVYDKQALVIINNGGAKPVDIINLSDAICKDVEKTFGITIKPEVTWI